MIKIAVISHRFLNNIAKIPFFKHFFALRIDARNSCPLNIPDNLFQFMLVPNRTSKETAAHRFSDLDEISTKYISDDAVVHDIAVSSGITSVELFDKIVGQGKHVHFFVSDKYSEYRVTRGIIKKIIDINDNSVGFYLFGIYASNELSSKYFLSKILFKIITNFYYGYRHEREFKSDKILIFCGELIKHFANGDIQRIEYDVFTSKLTNMFDYARCMNLLNLSYFDKHKIFNAINNILLSLREGGVLQVGRTHSDGTNHASFYIKEKTKFKLILNVNSGSEINNIILL